MRSGALLGVIFGVLLAGGGPAQAQPAGVVSGAVYDAETGAPLPGVHVFLAGSLAGTVTAADGGFRLDGVPEGSHELVVSHVGYEAHTERIRLDGGGLASLEMRLAPRVVEAAGVEVTALSDRTWRRHRKTFEQFFLGVSRNASACEILNPDVLDFRLDEATGQFTARASEPLLIENRALGYRLRFVLEEFVLREDDYFVQYRGRVGFDELEAGGEREQRRWARERERAYRGSTRHFLTALAADRLWEEGYLLLSEEDIAQSNYAGVPGSRPSDRVTGVAPEEIMVPGALPSERTLDFTGYLKVVYFDELPSDAFLRFRRYASRGLPTNEDQQVSWIALSRPGTTFTVDGHVTDTYGLTKFGYWYFERVAELLPREYQPPGVMVAAATPASEAAPPLDLEAALAAGVAAAEAERYGEAVQQLGPVVEADAAFQSAAHGAAAFWLGQAYAGQGLAEQAHTVWLRGLEALAAAGRFDVRLADAYVRSVFARRATDAYEPAAWAYLDLLRHLDRPLAEADRARVHRHLAQLLPLLTDEERAAVLERTAGPQFQNLRPREGAGAWLAAWWSRQDPLPGSGLNERVAEHLARVAYALEHFDEPGLPAGYDDRGPVFVRYGPPRTLSQLQFDLSRSRQIINAAGVSLPGPLVPPNAEFWAYLHVDDLVYYLFVQEGGRFRIADPEDLVPRTLRDAYGRRGLGSGGNPDTPANPGGAYQRPDQVFAEALVEAWRDVFTQLAVYHPDFEEQLRAIELHDDDLRATGGGTLRASSLAFVKGMQTDFQVQARAAALRRETEAPRTYSRIGPSLDPLPVDVRTARFLAEDGTTRTEVFWSHAPGSLRPPRRILEAAVPDPAAVPDRYFVDLVVSLHDEAYSRRVPTRVRYLAAEAGGAAPVQMLDVAGVQGVNHLTFQWDQFTLAGGTAASDAEPGAYLRTGVHRVEGLTPLRPDPARLEMSDLKPVALSDDFALFDTAGDAEPGAPVPYPRTTLTPTTALGLYFEIYHLTFGADDQTHYTVAYDVVRPGGRTVSARSAYAGTARTARELIGIDLSAYDRPGPLQIIVRVTDDVSGQTMERAVDFELVR